MDFTHLDEYIRSIHSEKNIPGVGCAVCYRGEPVYSFCTGYADVENLIPYTEQTLYPIASATKISTVTAALQLVERGLIKLDAPLYEYIPEYRNMTVRTADENGAELIVPAKNTITVRNLFSMTAGITGGQTVFSRVAEETGGRCPTADIIRATAAEPLAFEPGTHFKYSFCHDVLGGLVEIVSGMKLSEYIKENIFNPLGMNDTFFRVPDDKISRVAPLTSGYDAKTNTCRSITRGRGSRGSEYESGGGGLVSCLKDYILLAQALAAKGVAMTGERILKPETVDMMRVNQLDEQCMKDFAAFGGWSKDGYGYGLGVRVLVNRDRNNSLSRNGEFGWDGAFGCYILMDPDSQVAIFYSQYESGLPWWTWHGMVRNTVYACLGQA